MRRGWRCFRIIAAVLNVDSSEGAKRNHLVKATDNTKSKSSDTNTAAPCSYAQCSSASWKQNDCLAENRKWLSALRTLSYSAQAAIKSTTDWVLKLQKCTFSQLPRQDVQDQGVTRFRFS